MAKLKLIVGLGNPGDEYAKTRHNVGAWWADKVCKAYHATLKEEKKFNSLLAKIIINQASLQCMIPTTYMNLSGKAVTSIANYYNIEPENILVIHDDLDLPPGSIKLKNGGGHQGHNGLRDIISTLGSNEFNRLRIGIGHPGNKNKVSSFVLHTPSKSEEELIMTAIDNSFVVLADIIEGNWQQAMHKLHSTSNDK